MIQLQRGSIYLVPDEAIVMPSDGLRKPHDKRPFLILSTNTINNGPNLSNVWGIPLSHKPPRASMSGIDFLIPEDEMGKLSEQSWVRIALGQPIPKKVVERRLTVLTDDTLQTIEGFLLEFLAIH